MTDPVTTKVVGRIEAPAGRVWDYLSWRGAAKLRNVSIIDAITLADDGYGAGSVRVLHLKDGSTISEYVEAMDDRARWYVYRPTSLGSLPVRDYIGRVEVSEAGPHACVVTIESSCRPVGVSVEEWQRTYTALETSVIEFVRHAVSRASSDAAAKLST